MTRTLNEPYYSLLDKQGRHDIRHAVNHQGLRFSLLREIIDHTWYGIKFKLRKRK